MKILKVDRWALSLSSFSENHRVVVVLIIFISTCLEWYWINKYLTISVVKPMCTSPINIFVCKVSIWIVNYTRATAFIFDSRIGVHEEVSKFLRQKCLELGGFEPPAFGCRLLFHLTYWGQTFPVIFLNIGSDGIDIFVCRVNIWNDYTVHIPVSIHEQMFLRKRQSFFLYRKCIDPGGTRIPNLRIHAKCSTIWATIFGDQLYGLI